MLSFDVFLILIHLFFIVFFAIRGFILSCLFLLCWIFSIWLAYQLSENGIGNLINIWLIPAFIENAISFGIIFIISLFSTKYISKALNNLLNRNSQVKFINFIGGLILGFIIGYLIIAYFFTFSFIKKTANFRNSQIITYYEPATKFLAKYSLDSNKKEEINLKLQLEKNKDKLNYLQNPKQGNTVDAL